MCSCLLTVRDYVVWSLYYRHYSYVMTLTSHYVVVFQIDGCVEVNASRPEVGWDYRYNVWENTQLNFHAHVTENGTGKPVAYSQLLGT